MRARRALWLFALMSLLSSSQAAFANSQKDASCMISLPVNVVVPDGRLIRELDASQFVAQTKRQTVPVLTATDDSGPRRILLVLESGRHVPERVRTAQYGVVAEILSEARPEDSFGLLTARGPDKEVHFGESRDAILAAVRELQANIDSKGSTVGILDALMTGAGWFDQPKPGDAIFLMSMGLESEHHATFKQVYKELTNRQVRVFSLLLGPRMEGTVSGAIVKMSSGGLEVLMEPSYSPNLEDDSNLSWGSGGYSVEVDLVGAGQREEQLTDKKLETLKSAASRMQSAITEYYRLTLESTPAQIMLGLATDLKNKVPKAVVLYPRQLPACSVAHTP